MKKDSKQRLFEVMHHVNPDFKGSLIVENKVYVKPQELPQQILAWAKSYLGNGFERNITIEKTNGKVEITMPWHDADKETHQFFKLTPNGAEMVGNPVSKTGWSETSMMDKPYGTVEIPSGYVLATVGTYPKRLRLTVSDDAMNLIPDNKELDNISDEALIALLQAKNLKSFARQKFSNEVYQELISLGLMNTQRAITVDGKNLITSPKAKEKLKQIKEKDQQENGMWNTKYKINF